MKLGRGGWAVAVLCTVAMIAMSAVSISYFLAGKWFLADVGNIQYCLINTWYGRFMWSPLAFVNHFGLHFTPFFFVLMPLVWLSPYPIPLVLSYNLALALTPIPVYLLARQRGLPAAVGVAAGVWFLCNHFLGSLQMANHFESFYVLFALAALTAIYSPRRHAWWVFALLALSVKEDAAVWMLGFAVWARFLSDDDLVRRRSLRLGALCLGWAALAVTGMMVSARGQVQDASSYLERMGGFSLGADNTWVFFLLIISSGGLCLLHWRAALLLLIPLPVILGNFEITRHLLYYYSYPFLPFLGFAMVAGLGMLWQWIGKKKAGATRPTAAVLALVLVALGAVQYGLPTRTDGQRRLPIASTPRDAMRRHVASNVLPRDVPVALQFGLWGVTPWRQEAVFLQDSQLEDHHYVFVDLYGVHGLTPAENVKVITRLRDEVQAGRRQQLYDAYDFVVIGPATEETGL